MAPPSKIGLITPEYIVALRKAASQVKDSWALCEFAGNCEAETIIAQTLRAAFANWEKQELPCSFAHPNLQMSSGFGLVDNPRGFDIAIKRGWIVSQSVPASEVKEIPEGCAPSKKGGKVTLLWPTMELFADIDAHIRRMAARAKARKR